MPYPPSTAGFTPLNEGFAGVILANPGSLQMYCINILTPTNIGYGYNLGTWDEANVYNVGFVARLLNDYYPNTAQPPIGVQRRRRHGRPGGRGAGRHLVLQRQLRPRPR